MTKEQEFRKQAEEAKFEAFSFMCKKVSKLEKENAELKAENQRWKDEWQEQVQKATDEGFARTLQTMQLTKAKKLLQFVSEYEDMTCYADELEEIKQFLKE